MPHDEVVYVGTVGEGLWRSRDGGESYERLFNGLFVEADVRALAVHPDNPKVMFAGTNCGLFRSLDGGDAWELLPTGRTTGWPGTSEITFWSVCILPSHPNVVVAGACPGALYRSEDGGDSWAVVDADISQDCGFILHTRVTCIAPDRDLPDTVWLGVEIDGIRRSDDCGKTWRRLGNELSSADIHSLVVMNDGTRRILAATNNDLNESADEGENWTPCGVPQIFPWRYCRGMAVMPADPNMLLLGNGNGPPGTQGAIQLSADAGRTWMQATLPFAPNSTVWMFAVTGARPATVYAATVSGQITVSRDSGKTWEKPVREFGEIRALAIL